MHQKSLKAAILLASACGSTAFSLPSIKGTTLSRRQDVNSSSDSSYGSGDSSDDGSSSGGCPAIWTTISSDLTSQFLSNGQCNDLARGAIRFAFHDAGEYSQNTPWYAPAAGGADGSLLLAAGEIDRRENAGLRPFYDWMTGFYPKYSDQVSAADLIQFAGAHATVTCPGGPAVQVRVGRTDTDQLAPEGLLPPGFGPGSDHDSLLQLFQEKGFSAADLAALIGAHSASRAFAQEQNGIPSGGPQDSTPGQLDVKYYSETYNPPEGVYRFDSDINLSQRNTSVGSVFQSFVGAHGKWAAAFVGPAAQLSVLGIPAETVAGFVDCTGALPSGTSAKRDIRARPINDRIR
ncbi:heme peroxidase [Phyllosticta citriasiana]|uniref:Peroxidase n=1 Tax=Phyllosticta citriasiana TaxID=595635 RepID=A0ABR1K8E4_9PEZI